MKRFRVRRSRREEARSGRSADEGRWRRGRRSTAVEGAGEPAGQGRGRAPAWPTDVAVPWERLLSFLIEKRDRDLSLWQLLERLGLGSDAAFALREQVALLEREGIVVHHRRGRVALRSRDRLVVGRLSIPASSRSTGRHWGAAGSFGFVSAPGTQGDLYLPARGLAGARHGDVVLARALSSARSDRTQGAVVAILQAAPPRFVGEVVLGDGGLRVRPRDERAAFEMPLAGDGSAREGAGDDRLESEEGYRRRRVRESAGAGARDAGELVRPGDLVVAESVPGPMGRARVVEVIGPAIEPASAEKMIRAAFALPGGFPEEAEREAEEAGRPLSEDDLRGREDFRSRTAITIDPADARDFDDAFSVEPLPGARLRLWVHIADVAHYVRAGGALDREALARGTSVYFPGQVVPMLPHALSSGICSLREGEDRLVQSVGIDYTREAKALAVRFADGVIRSAARLTYEEAAAGMEDPESLTGRGEGGGRAAALLAAAAPLARRLTENRLARGSLDLDLPEIEFRPAEEGLAASPRTRERTASHRLIEEFMLAANEAVARHLSEAAAPSLYRIHDPPDRADVEEVEETLAAAGVRRAGGRSLAARLQHLLTGFRGKPEESIVARHVLRAMKLARYADARADHFGLALTHYTHFTSPIRRYPDLVVHRILRAARELEKGEPDGTAASRRGAVIAAPGRAPSPSRKGGRASIGKDESIPPAGRLAEIAAESSRLERRAEGAERALNDLMVAHHMRARVGQVFTGWVSGMVRTGVFVALQGKDLPVGLAEGFAPTARASRLVLTESVRVRLEEADLLRGRLRLSLLEG